MIVQVPKRFTVLILSSEKTIPLHLQCFKLENKINLDSSVSLSFYAFVILISFELLTNGTLKNENEDGFGNTVKKWKTTVALEQKIDFNS